MRVTHLVKANGLAGVERHLLTLLPALRGRSVDADLVLLATPDNPAAAMIAAAENAGIPVYREVLPHAVAPGLLARLTRYFRRHKPDLVHTHLFHADVYGVLAARWAGVSKVVSSRYAERAAARRWTTRWLNRWLWKRIDHGIAVNACARDFALTTEGIRPEHITTVHYGLASDKLRVGQGARAVLGAELGIPSPEAPLIGLACRLDGQHDEPMSTLQAFWHISARHPEAHLLITGDGPLRQSLERQARGYGLEQQVHFLGWRDDMPAIIAVLDVLIVSGAQAGADMALLEAMALGTPVIASDADSTLEIVINGETGLLIPMQRVDLLTSSLALLLEDGELRRRMAAAARQRLESNFSVDRMVDEILDVYEQLLAG